MKWTHRVMVCLCACALLAGTPAWSLVLNPTYTNGGGEVWDDTRRGVVNQALGWLRKELAEKLELIDPKAFLGPDQTADFGRRRGLECVDWTTVGSDAFVEGTIEVDDRQFSVEFRIWDTGRCQRLLRKR